MAAARTELGIGRLGPATLQERAPVRHPAPAALAGARHHRHLSRVGLCVPEHQPHRHRHHPGGLAEYGERVDRPVLARPRRLHGGGRIQRRHLDERPRPAIRCTSSSSARWPWAQAPPRSPAGWWASPACACAAITSPSSRSGSARSSASPSRTRPPSAAPSGSRPSRTAATSGTIYFAAIATIIITARLRSSTHGRAFLAVREDEVAAEAMGVDTTGYKVRAFVISARIGRRGRGAERRLRGNLAPQSFTFVRSFEIVAMVVLGGMGSISGSVIAAIVLTLLPEALRSLPPLTLGSTTIDLVNLRMVFYSLALIGLMLSRPSGLFGSHELWELIGNWWRKRSNQPVDERRAAPAGTADGEHPPRRAQAPPSASAASPRSATSTCRSARASWWRSLDPTAPARPRSSTYSPASIKRPRAPSGSPVATRAG